MKQWRLQPLSSDFSMTPQNLVSEIGGRWPTPKKHKWVVVMGPVVPCSEHTNSYVFIACPYHVTIAQIWNFSTFFVFFQLKKRFQWLGWCWVSYERRALSNLTKLYFGFMVPLFSAGMPSALLVYSLIHDARLPSLSFNPITLSHFYWGGRHKVFKFA